MTVSLAEELPKEMARVRELLKGYYEIGQAGQFGAFMLEKSLKETDEAVASGDVVAMIRAFGKLKGCV